MRLEGHLPSIRSVALFALPACIYMGTIYGDNIWEQGGSAIFNSRNDSDPQPQMYTTRLYTTEEGCCESGVQIYGDKKICRPKLKWALGNCRAENASARATPTEIAG